MTGRTSWWFITAIVIGCITAIPKYGPYDIIVDRMETCEDEGTGQVHFGSKIRYAGGGQHIYNSTFRILVPIDEHFKVHFDVAIWGNQGWRPKAFVYTSTGCTKIWGTFGSIFKKLYKEAGVDVEGCPLPMGTFTPKNFIVEMNFDDYPKMFYRKNKAILTSRYKGVKVGCFIGYYEVVPKKHNATIH